MRQRLLVPADGDACFRQAGGVSEPRSRLQRTVAGFLAILLALEPAMVYARDAGSKQDAWRDQSAVLPISPWTYSPTQPSVIAKEFGERLETAIALQALTFAATKPNSTQLLVAVATPAMHALATAPENTAPETGHQVRSPAPEVFGSTKSNGFEAEEPSGDISKAVTQVDEDDGFIATVVGALRPRCSALTVSPAAPATGQAVTISASCLFRGALSKRVAFYNVTSGTPVYLGDAGGSIQTFTLSHAAAGSYTYRVVALNGYIPSNAQTITIAVAANRAPQVATASSLANAYAPGATVTWSVAATDPDGQVPQYRFFVDNIEKQFSTSGSFSWANATVGIHSMRVEVTDGVGGKTERTETFVVTDTAGATAFTVPTTTANVGTTAGSFSVSDSGGAAYSVPIATPAGLNGLQPNISINYSSQGGDGVMGTGFSVAAGGAVTRCPRNYSVDFKKEGINSDSYVLDTSGPGQPIENDSYCLDGQRLIPKGYTPNVDVNCPGIPAIPGFTAKVGKVKRMEYRTEQDTQTRVYAYHEYEEGNNQSCGALFAGPSRFEVWTKDGRIADYGLRKWLISDGWGQSQGGLYDRRNSVKAWMLDRVSDRFGNYMNFEYIAYAGRLKDAYPATDPSTQRVTSIASFPGTEVYLSSISYGYSIASNSEKARVEFEYSSRVVNDQARLSDSGGGETYVSKVLDRIKTFDNGYEVKRHDFLYGQSPVSNRVRLASIQECVEVGATCLPKTQISWRAETAATATAAKSLYGPGSGVTAGPIQNPTDLSPGSPGDLWADEAKTGDMRGTGKSQLLWRNGATLRVCSPSASGATNPLNCGEPWAFTNGVGEHFQSSWTPIDLNGDGKADYLAIGPGRITTCITNSTGTGFSQCKKYERASSVFAQQIEVTNQPVWLVGDFDGDGRMDVAMFRNTDASNDLFEIYFGGEGGFDESRMYRPAVAATNPQYYQRGHQVYLPRNGADTWINAGLANAYRHFQSGDFDGDGKTDFLQKKKTDDYLISTSPQQRQWRVCFSDIQKVPGFTGEASTQGAFTCPTTGGNSTSPGWMNGPHRAVQKGSAADFNGDGIMDFAVPINAATGEWQFCLSSGEGSFSRATVQTTGSAITLNPTDGSTLNIDSCSYLTNLIKADLKDTIFGDFDGDGRTDMATATTRNNSLGKSLWRVCYARGNTANDSSNFGLTFACEDNIEGAPIDISINPTADLTKKVFIGDFNGDGRTDLVTGWNNSCPSIRDTESGPVNVSLECQINVSWSLSAIGMPDLVSKVTTGLGATTSIEYAPLTDTNVYTPLAAGTPLGSEEISVTSPMYVVASVSASNPGNADHVSYFKYGGLRAHRMGRGLYGFTERHSFEPTGVVGQYIRATTRYNFSNVKSTTVVGGITVENADDELAITPTRNNARWPMRGRPIESEKRLVTGFGIGASEGARLNLTKTAYTQYMPHGATYWQIRNVFVTKTEQTAYELDGSPLPTTVTETVYADPTASSAALWGMPDSIEVKTVSGTTTLHSKLTTNTYDDGDIGKWISPRLIGSKVVHTHYGATAAENLTTTRGSSFEYFGSNANNKTYDWSRAPTASAAQRQAGLLKTETVESADVDNSLRSKATHGYDAFGNRTSTTLEYFDGSVARATSTTFTTDGRFVASVKNALDHVELRSYSPGTYAARYGMPSTITGPNGSYATFVYDAFGRKISEKAYSQTGTLLGHKLTGYEWVTQTAPKTYKITQQASGAAAATTYFDALQRATSSETLSFDGGTVTTATAYDIQGRKKWTKRPIGLDNGTSASIAQIIDYDALSRPAKETTLRATVEPETWLASRPVADVLTENTMSYGVASRADRYGVTAPRSALTTARKFLVGTNWNTQSETKYSNEQGQAIESIDALNQATYFKHDAAGNLIRTDSPGSVSTSIAYNLAGRKTRLLDPNSTAGAFTDATPQHHRYEYFATGQLKKQIDSAGRTTEFTYDKLDRPLTRTEPYGDGTGATLTTTYTYDTCAFGKGKLCTVQTNQNYARQHDYDTAGRGIRTTVTVAGQGYTSATGYDSESRPKEIAYPARAGASEPLILTNTYNARGFLTTIAGRNFGQKTYFSAISRYSDGAIYQYSAGGVTHTKGYDALGRIKSIQAGVGSAIQNASLSFDGLGNVRTRTDAAAGLPTETFDYDALNRMTTLTRGATVNAFRYADGGNLTYKGDIDNAHGCTDVNDLSGETHTYGNSARNLGGNAGPHALRTACGRTYSYDLTGNVTGDGLRTLGNYTSFNLPRTISGNGNTLSYTYDADHQRLTETVVGVTGAASASAGVTTYIGQSYYEAFQPAGQSAATQWKHYISSPEGIVAIHTDNLGAAAPTTKYWAKDHLGSIVAEYDEGGAAASIQRYSFDAWGKRRNVTGEALAGAMSLPNNLESASTSRGFTGHEMLDEVGLVHMNGRIYDPLVGRFMQADPIIQDPYLSQSYNRYSYVLNNPLSYTDPSGFSWWTKWRAPIMAVAAMLIVPQLAGQIMEGMVGYGSAWAGESLLVGVSETGSMVLLPAGNAAAAMAGGFAAGGVGGGNLQSAITGAFTALASFGVGEAFSAHGGTSHLTNGMKAGHAGAHAAVGCASAVMAGGSCKAGAMAAGFSALAGPAIGSVAGDSFEGNLLGRMAVGGVASKLGGGEFASGALSAAFEYLYNNGGAERRGGGGRANSGEKNEGHFDPSHDSRTSMERVSARQASEVNLAQGRLIEQGLYRGGRDFQLKPGEIKLDSNGLVLPLRGPSLDINTASLPARFNGVHMRVNSIPAELQIVPYGRPGHYEIVPMQPMTSQRFQSLLNQIR